MGSTPSLPLAGTPTPAPSSPTLGPPVAAGPGSRMGGGAGGPGGASTPEQRAAWRAKSKARYDKRKTLAPLPAAGGAVASKAGGPGTGGAAPVGASPAAPAAPAPIPWTGDTLKPLFDQLIPAAEKLAVERLATRAAKIDPALAAAVAKDAAWNPAAKVGLQTAGPQCAAELLTEMGIGADKAHWAALVIAAGSIATAHVMLAGRLEALARAKSETAAPEPAKAAPTPGDGGGRG